MMCTPAEYVRMIHIVLLHHWITQKWNYFWIFGLASKVHLHRPFYHLCSLSSKQIGVVGSGLPLESQGILDYNAKEKYSHRRETVYLGVLRKIFVVLLILLTTITATCQTHSCTAQGSCRTVIKNKQTRSSCELLATYRLNPGRALSVTLYPQLSKWPT